ncbi:hypothetical protein Plhal304r1_c002g0006881 [Plasmopara halstedii]
MMVPTKAFTLMMRLKCYHHRKQATRAGHLAGLLHKDVFRSFTAFNLNARFNLPGPYILLQHV